MISILRTKIDILSDIGETLVIVDVHVQKLTHITVFLKTDKIKVCVLWTYSQ